MTVEHPEERPPCPVARRRFLPVWVGEEICYWPAPWPLVEAEYWFRLRKVVLDIGDGKRDEGPFFTAVHECGHASAQAVLGAGPRQVCIKRDSDGWSGQSLADEDANSDEKIARLLVAELAWPIAQIAVAPGSLGDLCDTFRDALIAPSLNLLRAPDRPLNRLGWEGDLSRSGVEALARFAESCWRVESPYNRGGFLFHAERALFGVYRAEPIRAGLVELATILVRRESIAWDAFRSLASEVLKSSAWGTLRSLDLSIDLSSLIK